MTILPAHGNKWKITGGFVGSCGIYSLAPFQPRKMYQLADDVAYPEHSKYDEGILSKRTTCIPLPDMFKRQARDFRRLFPWNFRNPRHPRQPKKQFPCKKLFLCSLPIHVTSATTTERYRERKKTHRERVRPKRGVD